MPNDQPADFDGAPYRTSAAAIDMTGYRFFRSFPQSVAAARQRQVDAAAIRVGPR
jgi:hypothetical protein